MKRSSLTCPIDPADRERMAHDLFYKRCCIQNAACSGRIQWHHALTYAGKRIPDAWAILPLCEYHHTQEAKHRQLLKGILLARVSIDTIRAKYPKIIL